MTVPLECSAAHASEISGQEMAHQGQAPGTLRLAARAGGPVRHGPTHLRSLQPNLKLNKIVAVK
jgi:hypothetical protein